MTQQDQRAHHPTQPVRAEPPAGLIPQVVRCPTRVDADALLIAAWRADQRNQTLRPHLNQARKLIDDHPARFQPIEVQLSDHDRATVRRLGCGADVEGCLVAAFLTIGVLPMERRKRNSGSWDHKLFERRAKPPTG